jgi:ubiquinone/menaquinone biosynthesis C-methylase UbiE
MPTETLNGLIGVPAAMVAMPSESLRRRTQGSNVDPQVFIDTGRRCRDDLRAALQAAGLDWDRFSSVLDFGCGCGRTLVWMADQSTSWKLHGTDVDSEAVTWCQAHLPFARCDVNDGLPPLDYADASFDLVYAIAVFTHLDQQREWAWLQELRRVTVRGGVVVLTVFGQHCTAALSPDEKRLLDDTGMVFMFRSEWKGLYPDWFGLAYHTEAHVRHTYGRLFDVLAYRPRGLNNHLDVIVCRKE